MESECQQGFHSGEQTNKNQLHISPTVNPEVGLEVSELHTPGVSSFGHSQMLAERSLLLSVNTSKISVGIGLYSICVLSKA